MLCNPTLAGTFCQTCDRSNTSAQVFFVKSTDDEPAHCEPCGDTFGNTILVACAVLAGLAVAAVLLFFVKKCIPHKVAERWELVMRQVALKNKLKILHGFYIIVTK